MDIAALSTILSQSQLKTDASFAIMNKTKELMQNQGEQLAELIEKSTVPHPHLGHRVDLKV